MAEITRRTFSLSTLASATLLRAGVAKAQCGQTPVLMDGHVHAINRVYWEKIDTWEPHEGGWDFARARAAGVNCVIDDIGTYGAWNYNYTPKQALRLIETFHRFAEDHADKMGVALNVADARRIIASGRVAVFLGCESGWDDEGDPDVLGAFYRLGLRVVQFPTQTGFNAFSDSVLAVRQGQPVDYYHGINERGRMLISEMNRLGVLIDVTHGTEAAQLQITAASRTPVVASHESLKAVSGTGLSDEVLKAIAAKGGLVGIHSGATVIGKRFRQWLADNPEKAAAEDKPTQGTVGFRPSKERPPGDRGEYEALFDREFAERWRARVEWREDTAALPFLPTIDDWADHVVYVIKTAGADHVAIGLDLAAGRSSVPKNASGYGDLVAALNRITTPANVRKITGENWFRVLGQAKTAQQ
jgi:membrane dipeptidase